VSGLNFIYRIQGVIEGVDRGGG